MDFMALIAEYVKPELLIIAVCCYVLGMFLKVWPAIKDWVIPFVVLLFGIILAILYLAIVLGGGFAGKVIIEGFIQGLLCAALAVFANQLIKQAKKQK
jgi:nicotinamide riboside transporter PnuC